MFEIAWPELLMVALVALVVLKPKDIPEMARQLGAFLAKARTMAGEFQGQFNEAMKDAKLDDVKKVIDEVRDLRNLSPVQQVRDTLNKLADEATTVKKEFEQVGSSVNQTITSATQPLPQPFSSTEPGPAPQPMTAADLGLPPPEPAPPLDLDPLRAAPAPEPAPVATAQDAAPPPKSSAA